MWPILFEVPNTKIRLFSFGLMMVVALGAALGLASWRARREKLDPDLISDMAFWVILCGLLGARLSFVWGEWGNEGMRSLADAVAIWRGGIVLYGSILGGVCGFLIYRALRPFPVRPTLDAIAPALAVGIGFGRIGCFLNGCCYGDRCALPWSVRFPSRSIPWGDHLDHGWISETAHFSLPVHPTQLYSSIDGFLLAALLCAYYPFRRRDGEVLALLMVTLPVSRFLIEILRDDDSVFAGGMTIAQAISVAVFVGGIGFWAWLSRQPAVRYADTAKAVETVAV